MSLSVNIRLLIFLLALLGSGCSWNQGAGPGILVIAVENLAFERVGCESSDLSSREFESFRVFCEEGVRFTHAYTTSALSQPALASILTGLYPIEHGLRTNGAESLAARFETVGERAVTNGARTALFSGGPPIFRKSGLSQGFEIFDDFFEISETRFYRPALDVAKSFLGWIDREVGKKSFFAVMYLADLQFPGVATSSDLGELRERSGDSQTREIAESLSWLIAELRQRGLWHKTHVVLVGLNGQSSRAHEIPPLNVYADNTQVALFFKPARRSRDQGPQWTIDKNVSLADLGSSLFEMVGGSAPPPALTQLPRISVFSVIDQVNASWDDDRLILIESGWGSWRSVSGIRLAARRRQYFYVHDESPRIYNTLIDRLETNPLPVRDPLWQALSLSVLDFFSSLDLPKWSIRDEEELVRISQAQLWWQARTLQGGGPDIKLTTNTAQDRRWLAQRYLERGDWSGLLRLASAYNEPLYTYVAQKNLGLSPALPKGACAQYFAATSAQGEVTCDDETFVHLLQWKESRDKNRREWLGEAAAREFRAQRLAFETGAANYARFLPWDVSLKYPEGANLTALFLALPENRSLGERIRSRSGKNDALDL